jgi:serine/threonine protein phosphatase PrpC
MSSSARAGSPPRRRSSIPSARSSRARSARRGRSRSTRAPSALATGDVYLLCSDGLTTMVPEAELKEILLAHPRLRDAGEALIAAANEAGGRDNITVLLLRLEEVQPPRAARSPIRATGDAPTGIPARRTGRRARDDRRRSRPSPPP